MNQEIRKKLLENVDESYREFHSNLCPGTNNILGIRVPVLRGIAKELAKEDWRENYAAIGNEYYEEIMLQGMILGLAKADIEEIKQYLTEYIPKIDNWAVCDVCCAGLKITKKHKKEMWDFLQTYLKSNKEFEIRFGVVMLLDYYITPEYLLKLFEQFDRIGHPGYYVKMAVAWAISICYIKFPKETSKYLECNQLDDFTYNKAIQKTIESYRVPKEEKEILRKRKR